MPLSPTHSLIPATSLFPWLSRPQYAPMDPVSVSTMGIYEPIGTLPLSPSADNDMTSSKLLESIVTCLPVHVAKIFHWSLLRGQLLDEMDGWKVASNRLPIESKHPSVFSVCILTIIHTKNIT